MSGYRDGDGDRISNNFWRVAPSEPLPLLYRRDEVPGNCHPKSESCGEAPPSGTLLTFCEHRIQKVKVPYPSLRCLLPSFFQCNFTEAGMCTDCTRDWPFIFYQSRNVSPPSGRGDKTVHRLTKTAIYRLYFNTIA